MIYHAQSKLFLYEGHSTMDKSKELVDALKAQGVPDDQLILAYRGELILSHDE